MFVLGLWLTLVGVICVAASFVLGFWKDGVLLDTVGFGVCIGLGIWVGGVPVFGGGFWLATLGALLQLIRIL